MQTQQWLFIILVSLVSAPTHEIVPQITPSAICVLYRRNSLTPLPFFATPTPKSAQSVTKSL